MKAQTIFQYDLARMKFKDSSHITITQVLRPSEEVYASKSSQGEKAESFTYWPCFKCKRHPYYPGIPPITLHLDNRCAICDSVTDSADLH